MNGRILHLIKTFDGATWAALEARELIRLGWEIHVVCPETKGRNLQLWKDIGAIVHFANCSFPAKTPWLIPARSKELSELVELINPDIIHSHFVTTTLLMRYALKNDPRPRIFQVPGPLHLENYLFGTWEKCWAQDNDWWIASSNFIRNLYLQKYAISEKKVFLSYYGADFFHHDDQKIDFKKKYHLPEGSTLIGNVSYIYPPKTYLGHKVGIKGHELMIEALARVLVKRSDIYMIFIGPQWGTSQKYLNKLKKKAAALSPKFIFSGHIPQQEVLAGLGSIDLIIHVPTSENCGGVVEAMIQEVPVIASPTGGLPEAVIPNKTGSLLPSRSSNALTRAIYHFLEHRTEAKTFAKNGKPYVTEKFNIQRTAKEVNDIYYLILSQNRRSKK